jgi:MFS family permease
MRTGTNDSASSTTILGVLAAGAAAYSVLQAIVAPALPELAERLDVSSTDVSWVLTALLLSASVLTPVIGRLGDLYGKQRLLVASLAVMTLGTLVSALATGLGTMLAGRILQGAGAGVFPLAFAIVRDELPAKRVPNAIGMLSAMLGIGSVAGLVVSGVIVEHLSYHWLFWLPLALCVGATVATAKLVPESPVHAVGTVAWGGALLLAAGLVVLLLGVTQGERWGWGSAANVGAIAGGVVLLILWTAVERRSSKPLVDMRVLARRGVWTVNAVTLAVGFGMLAGMAVLPLLLQLPTQTGYGFGKSVMGASLCMIPAGIGILAGGVAAGGAQERLGTKPVALSGLAIIGVAYAYLALRHHTTVDVLGAAAVQGIGVGVAFSALGRLAVESVPQAQTGAATAINTIMRTVGAAFGSSIPAAILAAHLTAQGIADEGAFTTVFWVTAAVALAGLVVGTAIPSKRAAADPGLAFAAEA